MADKPEHMDLAYREAACRVLRARRKRDVRRAPRWRQLLGGAAAAPLLVAAVWLERVAATPVEAPPAAPSAPQAPELASDGGEAARTAAPAPEPTQIQPASAALSLTPWLSVASAPDDDIAALRV